MNVEQQIRDHRMAIRTIRRSPRYERLSTKPRNTREQAEFDKLKSHIAKHNEKITALQTTRTPDFNPVRVAPDEPTHTLEDRKNANTRVARNTHVIHNASTERRAISDFERDLMNL